MSSKSKTKEKTITVDIRKTVTMKVTEKGQEMNVNSWKAGDIITVGEVMSVYFKEQGVATLVK